MQIRNLTLGAIALLASVALAQNHNNTHTVRKGETLDKIAKAAGIQKKELIAANNLHGKHIKPGQVLKVPHHSKQQYYNITAASGYAPYTIRKHDSDWKIANMFHMAPKSVRTLNPKVSWKSPKPGTVIRIPLKNAYIYKLASIPVIRTTYAVTTGSNTIVRSKPGGYA